MEGNNEQIKKGNTGLIIVLLLIIVGLAGYIVYDKVLSSKETNINDNDNQEVINNKVEETLPDKNYFDEYLYVFLPMHSASHFLKNINSFSNEEITSYLYWYYVNQGLQKKIQSD